MAAMARATWARVCADVVRALEANPGYDLVVTGHSLGAGTAALLTLLLYHARSGAADAAAAGEPTPLPPAGTRLRCFAFACPPVFDPGSGGGGFPYGYVENVHAFVYGSDCVPFLSLRAGRELFTALYAVHARAPTVIGGSGAVLRCAAGRAALPPELVAAAHERVAALPVLDKAPELIVPARSACWVRPDDAVDGRYDAVRAVGCELLRSRACAATRAVGAHTPTADRAAHTRSPGAAADHSRAAGRRRLRPARRRRARWHPSRAEDAR
eukprot:256186-Prymnesium_polylepis.2